MKDFRPLASCRVVSSGCSDTPGQGCGAGMAVCRRTCLRLTHTLLGFSSLPAALAATAARVPRLFSQALDGSQPPGAGLPVCEAPICCLG